MGRVGFGPATAVNAALQIGSVSAGLGMLSVKNPRTPPSNLMQNQPARALSRARLHAALVNEKGAGKGRKLWRESGFRQGFKSRLKAG